MRSAFLRNGTLPGRPDSIAITQGADGLWRMGAIQAEVRLSGAGKAKADSGEHLELMGLRRVGQVEVLEHKLRLSQEQT